MSVILKRYLMATDINAIISNLLSFYDFNNKTIISVGAGGGQFIEYAHNAAKVYAVDNDSMALERLSDSLVNAGLTDRFTLVHSEFEEVSLKGDVVLFEFSLHEMPDAEASVRKALTMAPELVISDHLPGSEWAYVVGEEQKVADSRMAVERFTIKRHVGYDSCQRFAGYNELYQKVKGQGDEVIRRISKYKNQTGIEIPMPYGFVLI